jgi:hypothetical protein
VTWLSWRQFRLSGSVVAAAVALVALVLAATRPELTAGNVFDQLTDADRTLFFAGIVAVAVAPAVVGAFWGAPLVARELENGTHRLVWNQGVTRTRWLATRLGMAALTAAAAVGVLTLAVHRWSTPLDGALASGPGGSLPARMTPVSFAMRGVVPVSYAVFAVVLGTAAGLLLRRTVPAMAVTLLVFLLVQVAVPLWVRPHLLSPTRETVAITEDTFDGLRLTEKDGRPSVRLSVRAGGAGSWVLSDRTLAPDGTLLDEVPTSVTACQPRTIEQPREGRRPVSDCLEQLTAQGYRQQVVYQPASRFWPLQWAETGLFLGLSALLAALCLGRVRKV